MMYKFHNLDQSYTDDDKINEIVNYLEHNHIFKTLKDTKEIYFYDKNNGIFVNNGEALIEQEAEVINPEITTKKVKEIINHIKRRTYTDRKDFDSKVEWLTCKNRVINLKTLRIK